MGAVGDGFLVRRGGTVVARVVLAGRSDTPPDWYEPPIAPFVVTLEVLPSSR